MTQTWNKSGVAISAAYNLPSGPSDENDNAIEAVSDWSLRNLSAQDGHWIRHANGGIYRYSATVGDYVRPYVYDGTVALDAVITGDVAPSAEGWTHGGGANASITSDGTTVTLTSLASDNTANPTVSFSHGAAAANHYVQGYMACTSYTGANAYGALLRYGDGTKMVDLYVKTNALDYWVIGVSGAATGVIGSTYAPSSERWIEWITDASGFVTLYVDHSPLPTQVALYSASAADAIGTQYLFGDQSNTPRSTITIRQLSVGRW